MPATTPATRGRGSRLAATTTTLARRGGDRLTATTPTTRRAGGHLAAAPASTTALLPLAGVRHRGRAVELPACHLLLPPSGGLGRGAVCAPVLGNEAPLAARVGDAGRLRAGARTRHAGRPGRQRADAARRADRDARVAPLAMHRPSGQPSPVAPDPLRARAALGHLREERALGRARHLAALLGAGLRGWVDVPAEWHRFSSTSGRRKPCIGRGREHGTRTRVDLVPRIGVVSTPCDARPGATSDVTRAARSVSSDLRCA